MGKIRDNEKPLRASEQRGERTRSDSVDNSMEWSLRQKSRENRRLWQELIQEMTVTWLRLLEVEVLREE